MRKILVAISGGVDSSVAALLLKKGGWQVEGVHFVLSSKANLEICSKLENKLDIKIHVLDLREIFQRSVISVITKKYMEGKTPNPCVLCNPQIKFSQLIEFGASIGINYVATGHYARKERVSFTWKDKKYVEPFISKARDRNKDQTYFLSRLFPSTIKRCQFPLGTYVKEEVRTIARSEKLPTASTEESQGLCFVEKSIEELFGYCRGNVSGDIKDTKGNVLGVHEGLAKYTIGQRKGIKIGGSGPYFVVSKNHKKNILIVSNVGDEPLLHDDVVFVDARGWKEEKRYFYLMQQLQKNASDKFVLKLRYGHPASEIESTKIDPQGIIKVKLKRKIRAVTPGQEAVFYDKNGRVWLGGEIRNHDFESYGRRF